MDHALCLTALRLGELGRDHDQAQVEHEERTDLTTAPRRRKQQRHVCVQLPIRLYVSRQTARSNRSTSFARRAHSSKPAARCCSGR